MSFGNTNSYLSMSGRTFRIRSLQMTYETDRNDEYTNNFLNKITNFDIKDYHAVFLNTVLLI